MPSILIVDKDAFLAGIYGRRFEEAHWKVRIAETPEDAERHFAKEVPDAVLLDIEGADDALEALGRWRKDPKTAAAALVVLTRLGDREALARAKEAGADTYLLKGHFVPSEVERKVRRLVEAPGRQ